MGSQISKARELAAVILPFAKKKNFSMDLLNGDASTAVHLVLFLINNFAIVAPKWILSHARVVHIGCMSSSTQRNTRLCWSKYGLEKTVMKKSNCGRRAGAGDFPLGTNGMANKRQGCRQRSNCRAAQSTQVSMGGRQTFKPETDTVERRAA